MKGLLLSKWFVLCILLLVGSAVAEPVKPDLNKDSLASVENDIQALLQRVDQLEQEDHPSWLDKFTFKGDFRYRYEMIDRENGVHRNRNRIRARFFVGAELNESVDFGFQLATGSNDPVSTNQTIGDGWSTKAINLDMAYFDFHPFQTDKTWDFSIIGGKMKNPFRVMSKSELLWDPDLRPEGVAAVFSKDLDCLTVFASVGGFYLVERSTDTDTSMFGGQAGVTVPVGEEVKLTVGGGFYNFGNVKGRASLFDPLDPFGNTTTPGPDTDMDGNPDSLLYATDFDEGELFGEAAFKVADLPVSVFGNYVNNAATSKEDQGYVAGFKVGKVKDPGTWDFRYQYKRHQQNDVIGLLTDSDFVGGGTDAKGHELNLGLGIAKGTSIGLTYFANHSNLSGPAKRRFERFQLDFKLKF